jgi:hypothetical protein
VEVRPPNQLLERLCGNYQIALLIMGVLPNPRIGYS